MIMYSTKQAVWFIDKTNIGDNMESHLYLLYPCIGKNGWEDFHQKTRCLKKRNIENILCGNESLIGMKV